MTARSLVIQAFTARGRGDKRLTDRALSGLVSLWIGGPVEVEVSNGRYRIGCHNGRWARLLLNNFGGVIPAKDQRVVEGFIRDLTQ